MKKTILFLGLASLAVFGCQKFESVADQREAQKIVPPPADEFEGTYWVVDSVYKWSQGAIDTLQAVNEYGIRVERIAEDTVLVRSLNNGNEFYGVTSGIDFTVWLQNGNQGVGSVVVDTLKLNYMVDTNWSHSIRGTRW